MHELLNILAEKEFRLYPLRKLPNVLPLKTFEKLSPDFLLCRFLFAHLSLLFP